MPAITTLLFDYGNTLIAFGPEQQAAQLAAMREVLDAAGVRHDPERLDQLRREQVMRPYKSNGVENDFREVCREIIARFAPDTVADQFTNAMMYARRHAFLNSVSVNPAIPQLLGRLRTKYRLGLLSNYPCRDSIIDSLRHLGLHDYFDAIVVSADVGFAKPHPRTYETLLRAMAAQPGECLYVGDNWLADVQGAKRHGLHAAWLREHTPYETFDPAEGDHPADLELTCLLELEEKLASM